MHALDQQTGQRSDEDDRHRPCREQQTGIDLAAPQTDCRKKGKDTIASICAVNEQTDVAIDMENMGIRNKSTGRSG